jgi:hypothetical protein
LNESYRQIWNGLVDFGRKCLAIVATVAGVHFYFGPGLDLAAFGIMLMVLWGSPLAIELSVVHFFDDDGGDGGHDDSDKHHVPDEQVEVLPPEPGRALTLL